MTLDLKTLFYRRHEFEFESATLGRFHCRVLSMNALCDIEEMFANKRMTGRPFVVKLLTTLAERVPEAEGGKAESEREGTPLTEGEANRLSDDEIEAFAREFLSHNCDLLETYEGVKNEYRTNEKGARVISIAPRPVDLPKAPDEKDSDYLARVLRRYLDEQSRQLKKLVEPLSDFFTGAGLSQATQNVLRENFLLSDRLRGSAGALATAAARPYELETPAFRMPDLPPNPAFETNARLNDVILHIQELRPLAGDCANLIRNMNDSSIRMLADFSRNARKTEIYTRITIGIAAISLFVTAVFSVLNYVAEDPAERFGRQLGAHMETLSTSQDQRTERVIAAFQAFLSKQSAEDRKAFVEALRKTINPSEQKPLPGGKFRE